MNNIRKRLLKNLLTQFKSQRLDQGITTVYRNTDFEATIHVPFNIGIYNQNGSIIVKITGDYIQPNYGQTYVWDIVNDLRATIANSLPKQISFEDVSGTWGFEVIDGQKYTKQIKKAIDLFGKQRYFKYTKQKFMKV